MRDVENGASWCADRSGVEVDLKAVLKRLDKRDAVSGGQGQTCCFLDGDVLPESLLQKRAWLTSVCGRVLPRLHRLIL